MKNATQYHRLRETVFDLYAERDVVPWYFKAIALASSWLALAGYIVFALVFTSADVDIKASRNALTVLAAVLLVVGYAVVAAVAVSNRNHSLLFLFDAVFLPLLTSSFMGLVVTVLNHALHKHFPIPSRVYIYVPLAVAGTTTVASASLALIIYRQLAKIKRLDRQRRQRMPRWDRDRSVSYGDAAATAELLPMNSHVPHDEAQRQQLLRLLLKREAAQSPAIPGLQSTYQISLPREGEGLGVQYDARPRSESVPSNPNRRSVLSTFTRWHSPNMESFKDPRERRREEIERASVLLTPGLEVDVLAQDQPQPWNGSPRYA